jgi:hypothetical protein
LVAVLPQAPPRRLAPATYVVILVHDDEAVATALQIMDDDDNVDNLSFVVTIDEDAFLTIANCA